MTLLDLVRISDELEAIRAGWEARILTTVEQRLVDAQAHAARALAERSAGRTKGAREALALALDRVDSIRIELAGDSDESLTGLIRDAREDLYREAFTLHREVFPVEYRVADPTPTRPNIELVRAAMIHGYDPFTELERPILETRRHLSITAGTVTMNNLALSTWHKQSLSALTHVVRTLLNDSTEYADGEARRDLTAPEFRSEFTLSPV